MTSFDVAHIREQGVDLIIIVMDLSFGNKTLTEQQEIMRALQECATTAGIAGTVVPVWDDGGGQMGFIAPPNWHPFFSGINLNFVAMNVNRKLTCE
jgi:hypothetical protein